MGPPGDPHSVKVPRRVCLCCLRPLETPERLVALMPVNVRGSIVSVTSETRLVSVRQQYIANKVRRPVNSQSQPHLKAKFLTTHFRSRLHPFYPTPTPNTAPPLPLLVKLFCIWRGRLEMGTDCVQGTFNQPRGVICWRLWRNGIPERAMAAVDAVC